MENIRYPGVNLYVLKNVHGYVAYNSSGKPWRRDQQYVVNPFCDRTIRMDKQDADRLLSQAAFGPECMSCGANPEDDDHQFRLVRFSDDEGLLLNEDGTKLQIKHDRPNTVGRITGITESQS